MAGRIRSHPGGILALLDFFADGHQPALEADLITHGYPPHLLGTPALPWHTAFVFTQTMATTKGSATAISVHGPGAQWTLQDQLLHAMAYRLEWLVWSKSKDASRSGAKPPKPTYLPGLEPQQEGTKHYGKAAPIEDVLAMLGPAAQAVFGDQTPSQKVKEAPHGH